MTTDRTTVFSTERLVVRRWSSGEIDDLLAVYGDADAMRWVGEGRAITRDECGRWIDVTMANYAKRGYGMFALEEKATRCGARTGDRASRPRRCAASSATASRRTGCAR